MKSLGPRWSLSSMPVSCWNHPDSPVSCRHPVIILKSPTLMMLLFWRCVSTLSPFSSGFLSFPSNVKEQEFKKMHVWMEPLLIRKNRPKFNFLYRIIMRARDCQHPAHRYTQRERVNSSKKTHFSGLWDWRKIGCRSDMFCSPSAPILLTSTARVYE